MTQTQQKIKKTVLRAAGETDFQKLALNMIVNSLRRQGKEEQVREILKAYEKSKKTPLTDHP